MPAKKQQKQPVSQQPSKSTRNRRRRRRRAMKPRVNAPRVRSLQLTSKARGELAATSSLLRSLTKAITLPAEADPVRYPTQILGNNQTALWHLSYPLQKDMTGLSKPNQSFLLTHSPVSPVWGTYTSTSARTCTWGTTLQVGTGGGIDDFIFDGWTDANTVPCYPMGDPDGVPWMYVPEGIVWSISIAGCNNAAGTVRVTLAERRSYTTFGEGTVSVTIVAGVGSSAQVPLTESKWIRLHHLDLNSPLVTTATFGVTITVNAGTGFWPIINNPALKDLTGPLGNARMNAGSLLMSNISAPLYRNGGVYGARVFYNTINIFSPSLADAHLAEENPNLKFEGNAETGAYTYLIPSTDSLTFSGYVCSPAPFQYALSDFADANFCSFSVSNDLGAKFVLRLQLDMHIEAVTDSQIYRLGVPLIPYDEFAAICTAATSLRPFTENPVHHVLAKLALSVLQELTPFLLPRVIKGVNGVANRIMGMKLSD